MKIVFLLSTLLLAWCIESAAEDNSEKSLQSVQAEIQLLSSELDKTKTSKTELYRQLKHQSQTISKLNRELHDLNNKIDKQSSELAALKKQQIQQNLSQAKQLEALSDQLRAAYLNAQPNYLKVLLNQHDPASFSRSSVYFEYFHQARQQQLAAISQTLQILTKSQQQLLVAQGRQQQLLERRQQQHKALQKSNQQQQLTLMQLDKKINLQGSRMSDLREQEKSLQAVFESLAPTKETLLAPLQSNTINFASLKGALSWPVSGKVIARYGSSRNIGTLTWQGIMIKSASGKDVISTASGRVVFSDWLRGFGLLLIIDHGEQYMSLYGNNQALLKEVGSVVSSGELIALSGDNGIRQYTGLYFEIRHKGNPTNPVKWLGKQG
ncbi:MAG: murein hydrolase activator EnvC family protein [Methylophagaceae bacterium]